MTASADLSAPDGRSGSRWRPRWANRATMRADEAYERGDYQTALRLWTDANQAGDPEGAFRIGELHRRAEGVIPSLPMRRHGIDAQPKKAMPRRNSHWDGS